MEVGTPFGLKPIGLGARDSLRTEAGLPLYGHELAGPLNLLPNDAGFSSYVKVYKPFFVGRTPYVAHDKVRKMENARFRMNEKNVRVPKGAANIEMGGDMDYVVDKRGRVIGRVLSCAVDIDGYDDGPGAGRNEVRGRRHTDRDCGRRQRRQGRQQSQGRRSLAGRRRRDRRQPLSEEKVDKEKKETSRQVPLSTCLLVS